MYCNKCGKKLPQDANICPECGNILEANNIQKENEPKEEIKKKSKEPSNIKLFLIGSGIGLLIVVAMFTVFTQTTSKRKILF